MKQLFVLCLLVLALTACEPTPEAQQDAPPEQEETPEEMAEPEAMPEEAEDAPEEEAPEPEPASDAADALLAALAGQEMLEYEVTYDITTSGQGESFSGEMTQFLKQDKMRMDMQTQGIETRTIIVDNTITSCNNANGWMCTQIDTAENEFFNPDEFKSDVEENEDLNDIRTIPGKTVAGVQAQCFEVISPDGTVVYCISDEAVPLYVKSSAEGYSTEMIATSYSTSVANSAFDPPATPGEYKVPGMPAGYENMIPQ